MFAGGFEMPEIRYCWRCGEDVPALTDDEVAVVLPLWKEAAQAAGLNSAFSVADFLRANPLCEKAHTAHERLTGRRLGTRCMQIFHKLSDFAPPCPNCGKPLRTTSAKQCLLCDWRRSVETGENASDAA